MRQKREEQLICLRLLDALTFLVTFGISAIMASADSKNILWVERGESNLYVAIHGVFLSISLLCFLGFLGTLWARRDYFYITELAHKALYQLHIATAFTVAAGIIWGCLQYKPDAISWFPLVLLLLLPTGFWRIIYGIVRSARENSLTALKY